MSERFRLQVKTHFDAAHYIRDYVGKCERLHGHRWEVEAVFEGSTLDRMNILADFGAVKNLMKRVVEGALDHYELNRTLNEPNVTAEFLARWMYKELQELLQIVAYTPPIDHQIREALDRGLKLVRTCVWESPECCVKYYQEEVTNELNRK